MKREKSMENFKENLKVNTEIKEEKLTERQARRTYEQFVNRQEEQFLLFINYLNKHINKLREDGLISPFLEFRARIKATNSALKNYKEKALDDVFGIEFICATNNEIKILQQDLDNMLKVHKEKKHNKANGYRAIHRSCEINKELVDQLNDELEKHGKEKRLNEEFPMVEVQYKTVEVFYEANYGTASHEKYKGVKVSQLQQLYDEGMLTVGEYIPYMWISDPAHDDMRELSTEEVLKKTYPSLVLKKTNEREEK